MDTPEGRDRTGQGVPATGAAGTDSSISPLESPQTEATTGGGTELSATRGRRGQSSANGGETEQSSTDRGGTEPLAALISVAVLCAALSVYAGFASLALSDSDDTARDRATLEAVWDGTNERGILELGTERLTDRLDSGVLPRGLRVAVRVTVVGEGGYLETVDEATFDGDGRPAVLEVPPSADVDARPVPVRLDDGEVRPGRLTVEVWDG